MESTTTQTMESSPPLAKPKTKYLYCYKCAILCHPNYHASSNWCPLDREHMCHSIDTITLQSFIDSCDKDVTKHKRQLEILIKNS